MTPHDQHDARPAAGDPVGHSVGAPSAQPRRPSRVLIVEDDTDTRVLFTSHLSRLGCSVVEVGSGEEALPAARLHRPDIAIVDLRLPGMPGEQVMHDLRADPETAHCRIVITSVLDTDRYPPSADAVLPKPFTRRQFEELLTTLIAQNAG